MRGPDSLAVVEEFHARAVAAGNEWAQGLARRVTQGLVPGELGQVEATEWVPRVGMECVLNVRGGAAVPVTVVVVDGEYSKVRLADGRELWDLTVLLAPAGRP